MTEPKKHRIFFALWPSDPVRQQIISAFKQSPQYKMQGRKMQPSNLHITLHFIGNVYKEKVDCLHEVAKNISAESFSLNLDCYGHFYKARVFWMGCKQKPEALKKLHKKLSDAFLQCDYQAESRAYAPHVTLMRKLTKPGEYIVPDPVHWDVNEFCLVESIPIDSGVEYRVIERYPLN